MKSDNKDGLSIEYTEKVSQPIKWLISVIMMTFFFCILRKFSVGFQTIEEGDAITQTSRLVPFVYCPVIKSANISTS